MTVVIFVLQDISYVHAEKSTTKKTQLNQCSKTLKVTHTFQKRVQFYNITHYILHKITDSFNPQDQ